MRGGGVPLPAGGGGCTPFPRIFLSFWIENGAILMLLDAKLKQMPIQMPMIQTLKQIRRNLQKYYIFTEGNCTLLRMAFYCTLLITKCSIKGIQRL